MSLFGKPAFGGTPSAFGTSSAGNSLFSQTKPVGVSFGQPAQGGGLFGAQTAPSTNLFGAASTAPSSSLFGQSNSAMSSGFASAQPTTGGLFGASTQRPLFGAPTTGASLFGAAQTPATTSSLFAAPAAGGLFSTAGFAAPSAASPQSLFRSAVSGTTVKFDAVISHDTMMKNNLQQSIQTKHQCMAAMKQYENKSLEELRVEDYMANRKGPTQPQTGGFAFGQPTSSAAAGTAMFSAAAQNKPLFGTAFQGTTAAAQPSTGGGLFGAQANKPLFGQPAATTSAFSFGGAATATTASTGLFGAKPQASIFGTPQQQPAATGLFGSSFSTPQAPTSAFSFGQPQQQQQAGSLFGAAKAPFGAAPAAPSTGFSFGGGVATSAFGSAAPAGGLFGAKTTTATAPFGGFNTQTTSAFGTPGAFGAAATAPSLFGPQVKPATGLFGQPAATGLFSGAAQQPSLFAPTQTAKPAFSFGSQPVAAAGGGAFGALGQTTNFGAAAQAVPLASDATALSYFQAQLLGTAVSPYGDTSLLKLLGRDGASADLPRATDPVAQQRALRVTPNRRASLIASMTAKPAVRAQPLITSPLGSSLNNSSLLHKSANASIFDGLDEDTAFLKDGYVAKRSVKKLIIRPQTTKPLTPAGQLPSPDDAPSLFDGRQAITTARDGSSWHAQPSRRVPSLNLDATGDLTNSLVTTSDAPIHADYANPVVAPTPRRPQTQNDASCTAELAAESNVTLMSDEGVQVGDSSLSAAAHSATKLETRDAHPAGIRSTRDDYYTVPSLDELADLTDAAGDCWLTDGLTVGRLGYGSVYWPGEVNAARLHLDQLVHFRHKEVVVYPDDDDKPSVGDGLNRRAEVTLERVWPNDKTTRLPIKDAARLQAMHYRQRLESAAAEMGAVFRDYRPASGAWVFEVPHFSKYGLLGADEDDEQDAPTSDELRLSQADCKRQRLVQRVHSPSPPLAPNEAAASVHAGLGGDLLNLSESAGIMEEDLNELDGANDIFMRDKLTFDVEGLLDLGTETISLMRESFFRQPLNDMNDDSSYRKGLVGRGKLVRRRLASYSVESPADARRSDSSAAGPPPLRPFVHQFRLAPFDDSLLRYRQRTLSDASCFRGRSFKAGWTSDRHLTRPSTTGGGLEIEVDPVDTPLTDANLGYVEALLECQLRHSVVSLGAVDAPLASTRPGVGVLGELLQLPAEAPARDAAVWKLCYALWADVDAYGGEDERYWMHAKRKQRLLEWISDVTDDVLSDELARVHEASAAERVCLLLRGGRVEQAACAAADMGDVRLSLLIAQADACAHSRRLCYEQLLQWRDVGADRFVDARRFVVSALLAGQSSWQKRSADGSDVAVDVCSALDWRRAFGIHLRYLHPRNESLRTVLDTFRESWGATAIADTCFHLLLLFTERSYQLERVLTAANNMESPLDCHLSWHLWCALQAIGFAHLAPGKAAALHVSYAGQLSAAGLLRFAPFVLLHIDDDERRLLALKDWLSRFVGRLTDADEQFIVQKLAVPGCLLSEARCLQARADGRHSLEARFALDAGLWPLAHSLFLRHVGPEALVNDDYDTLRHFLERLRPNSGSIRQWAVGGQILDEFVELEARLNELRDAGVQRASSVCAELRAQLLSLASRLDALDCPAPMQRLCQGEMSRRICKLFRLVLTDAEKIELAPTLQNLPMPDDCVLDEIHHTVQLCLANMPT